MPRLNSKRQQALDQLDIARDAITKAITLLGGHVRVRSVKRNQRVFTARQYLQSIFSRINVTRDLLQIDAFINTPVPVHHQALADGVDLRDDFEREYDATRRPEC